MEHGPGPTSQAVPGDGRNPRSASRRVRGIWRPQDQPGGYAFSTLLQNEIVRELPQFPGGISSLALLDDGERLAVGTEDGRLMVISVESQNPLFTAAAHQGQISCMDASPDGNVILTGGADEVVAPLGRCSGKELDALRGPSRNHNDRAFHS